MTWPRDQRTGPAIARELPIFPAKPTISRSHNDNHAFEEGPADELDCLRHVLTPDVLRSAELRARQLGIGADQVLIRRGVISEHTYLEHLSQHTGIALDDLTTANRADCLLADRQLTLAAASGICPLRRNDGPIWLIAPRGRAARMLSRLVVAYPHLTRRLRLMSSVALQRFLTEQGGRAALAHAATRGLHDHHPALSAAPAKEQSGPWPSRLRRGCGVGSMVLLPTVMAPGLCSTALALWFLGYAGLRLAGAFWPRRPERHLPPLPERCLPVYSVMVALYREASSVARLVQAIEAFDYPREKLDVILVIEPDDQQTHAAIKRLGFRPYLRHLVAPAVAPKTKPKALNWALPFARGSFVAVYDAEDHPDAGQLRAALDAFRRHGSDVACAQASLCIDNATHSWLSRMFATEYAGQFDLYLPGMSEMRLPLPLGGSSNHFRTDILREVGGWDAHNVTEDADLGFRLARFGYRSVTFDSTTYEEAPIHFHPWLRQRTRWMKGWLQTWCVHMRRPRQLWREAGARGFVTLNILAGGNVVTALAYPLMLGRLAIELQGAASARWYGWPLLHVVALSTAIVATLVVGWLGLGKRGRRRDSWILALTGIYWLYLSIAAWRAVLQYIWAPHYWEKTEHGKVGRTHAQFSEIAQPAPRSVHK
ncbi:glycosyltransferase family 2 protein [Tardiphaga sp.]|uniref:glycosyltransferase family 2 protein n=1 Tax=Tardiphaga sp. TaxID=1926292 RepID=UPI0025F001B1|nr:glycosyltransferase family 2 protein [Tardiphaga sp.]